MKNIITIDIDSEREDRPIMLNKPLLDGPESEELLEAEGGIENVLKKDIKDITLTSLYMASMLSESDEMDMLDAMESMIKNRKNEITGEN